MKTSPPVALTLTGIALAYLAAAADAQAQQRLIPPDADTSRMRVPVPLPRLPEFDLRIQSPEKSATPRAVDELEDRKSVV